LTKAHGSVTGGQRKGRQGLGFSLPLASRAAGMMAESVATAMAAADALRPAAALVGVGLPEGDGVALARALIALSWRPRVVLTSTDPDVASPDDVRGCGAGAFVPKDGSAQRAARRSGRARLAGWITSAMCRGRCG